MARYRLLVTLLSLVIVGIGATITILLAKGYTINQKTGTISGTGILAISSTPDAASVYLDNHLVGATNSTISYLQPRAYQVKMVKEGYFDYLKTVQVRKELVTKVEALLLPRAPTLSPMTFTNAQNPLLSLGGNHLVWAVSTGEKAGLWVADITDGRTLLASSEPRQIIKDQPTLFFSQAKLLWSPDSKKLLVTLQEGNQPGEKFNRNFILETDQLNQRPVDVTLTLNATLNQWQEDINKSAAAKTERLSPETAKVASEAARMAVDATKSATKTISAPTATVLTPPQTAATLSYYPDGLHWSVGLTKFFFQTNDGYIVYDLKEKERHLLKIKPDSIFWLPESPDSNHLVLVEDKQISIMEADGDNRTIIYSGNFLNNIAFPWSNGSRLIILANFNAPASTQANLYTISLR